LIKKANLKATKYFFVVMEVILPKDRVEKSDCIPNIHQLQNQILNKKIIAK